MYVCTAKTPANQLAMQSSNKTGEWAKLTTLTVANKRNQVMSRDDLKTASQNQLRVRNRVN